MTLNSHDEWPLVDYELVVNGARQPVAEAWIGENLLFVLRERLGLMAAKDGCGEGECGACTIMLDGEPVTACLVPAVAAAGRSVQTPESFALPQPDPVAAALAAHAGAGCGFCLPGIGMELRALLTRNPRPSPAVVREALGGHRCRCLAPERFVDAAAAASAALAPAGAADGAGDGAAGGSAGASSGGSSGGRSAAGSGSSAGLGGAGESGGSAGAGGSAAAGAGAEPSGTAEHAILVSPYPDPALPSAAAGPGGSAALRGPGDPLGPGDPGEQYVTSSDQNLYASAVITLPLGPDGPQFPSGGLAADWRPGGQEGWQTGAAAGRGVGGPASGPRAGAGPDPGAAAGRRPVNHPDPGTVEPHWNEPDLSAPWKPGDPA